VPEIEWDDGSQILTSLAQYHTNYFHAGTCESDQFKWASSGAGFAFPNFRGKQPRFRSYHR
jgi:hypothetical protein